MRRLILLIIWLASLAALGQSYPVGWTDTGASMPACQSTSNTIGNGTPGGSFSSNCQGLFNYSGALWDAKRNYMVQWGGGHGDYGGNEFATISSGAYSWLTAPTVPGIGTCTNNIGNANFDIETLPPNNPSGTCTDASTNYPNARHTYMGLTYMPSVDKYFLYGHALASGVGYRTNVLWLFDPTNNTFSRSTQTFQNVIYTGGLEADWDDQDGVVYVANATYLNKYNPSTDTMTQISSGGAGWAYGVGALDTKNRRMVILDPYGSGSIYHWALTGSAASNVTSSATNCSAMLTAISTTPSVAPGIVFDPHHGDFVIWPTGSGTVYFYDSATSTCSSQTYSGAPSAYTTGVYGRIRKADYICPGCFLVVNSPTQVYVWRRDAGGENIGQGCTTAYHIDKDCDGYGVGTSPDDPYPLLGPDADDNDPGVNTSASVISRYGTISAYLTARGYPTNLIYFIDPTSGNDANFGTYACSQANPCQTYDGSIGPSLHGSLAGGTVIYLSSTSTGINFSSYNPAASSSSNPLVFLAYPGSTVTFTGNNGINLGSNSYGGSQNVTFDGFKFDGTAGGSLGGIGGGVGTINQKLLNSEVTNWNIAFQPNKGSQNLLIQGNVFRNIGEHAIYPLTADQTSGIYSTSLYDCSTPWQTVTYGTPPPDNPHQNLVINGNLFYKSGANGFEPIHLNATICGGSTTGNIIWGNDGTGIGLQNGVENYTLSNNAIFDNSRAGITINLYGCDNNGSASTSGQIGTVCPSSLAAGTKYYPNDINNISIVNNTIWTGQNAPCVGCGTPTYGIYVLDDSHGSPGSRYVKNLTITNNLVVVYSNGNGFTSGGGSFAHFALGPNSYPDTYTIKNNLLYNIYAGNPTGDVMFAASLSDCTALNSWWWACSGAGTANGITYGSATAQSTSPGEHTFAQFLTYAGGSGSGNIWGNPQFASSSLGYSSTPELFNLSVVSGSPAIAAGTHTGAPTTDIRGIVRGGTPTIGAYEVEPQGSPSSPSGSVITGKSTLSGKSVLQ